MFVNQTAISAVLVIVFYGTGMVSERLFDTLIGVWPRVQYPALPLARAVPAALDDWVPQSVHSELAAGAAVVDSETPAAAAHAVAARRHASGLHLAARNRTAVTLAAVTQTCVDDLQRVIDLRPASSPGGAG